MILPQNIFNDLEVIRIVLESRPLDRSGPGFFRSLRRPLRADHLVLVFTACIFTAVLEQIDLLLAQHMVLRIRLHRFLIDEYEMELGNNLPATNKYVVVRIPDIRRLSRL